MDGWTIASAIATCAGALVGLVTAIFALQTYRTSKKLEFEERRPFVIASLITEESGEERNLYLVIRNVGDTPAKRIEVTFPEGKAWNWVRNPNYPFLEEQGGISVLGPGDSLKYFLGSIRVGNPLSDIDSRDIDVAISFDHPTKLARISDSSRLSLQDSRYLSR